MPEPTSPTSSSAGSGASAALLGLLAERSGGVLATLKRDGRPQLSNVVHAYDPQERVIRISVTDGRAKTTNLRRDPRASYHVTSDDFWAYTVVESTAELTSVTASPDDATADELVALYQAISGEHANWDEYRQAMIAQQRLVIRLRVEHVYGQPAR